MRERGWCVGFVCLIPMIVGAKGWDIWIAKQIAWDRCRHDFADSLPHVMDSTALPDCAKVSTDTLLSLADTSPGFATISLCR